MTTPAYDEADRVRLESRPVPPEPSAADPSPAWSGDAIALSEARETLVGMPADAGVPDDRPVVAETWRAFVAFAERPVVAAAPSVIEAHMCLFQWGTYDWGWGKAAMRIRHERV
ncbi:MAG TPA: hypothetical protein VMB53_14760 [Gaiellaceae bacterium]|nr:hypothetical protein [Gaiellaceae bacterium]